MIRPITWRWSRHQPCRRLPVGNSGTSTANSSSVRVPLSVTGQRVAPTGSAPLHGRDGGLRRAEVPPGQVAVLDGALRFAPLLVGDLQGECAQFRSHAGGQDGHPAARYGPGHRGGETHALQGLAFQEVGMGFDHRSAPDAERTPFGCEDVPSERVDPACHRFERGGLGGRLRDRGDELLGQRVLTEEHVPLVLEVPKGRCSYPVLPRSVGFGSGQLPSLRRGHRRSQRRIARPGQGSLSRTG